MVWPDAAERKRALPYVPPAAFWAKLGDGVWHPLAAHLADVGAVTQCLLDGRSVLADRLARALRVGGPLPGPVRRTAVYLACLHDVGKTQHGFQQRRHGSAGIPLSMLGHVRPLLRSLQRVPALHGPFGAIMRRVGGDAPLVMAICHHGRPYPLQESAEHAVDPRPYWLPARGRDPIAEVTRLDQFALQCSGLPSDAVPAGWTWTPHALHLLAGVLTLADWIGSSERYFPHQPAADDDWRAYWTYAQERAGDACTDVGVRPRSVVVPGGATVLARLFPCTFPAHAPTALQQHVVDMPLPDPGTRLLIESDTGSGKTEAALTLYARLRAAGRVDGLFFALPTRATASAMYTRIGAVVDALYGAGARPNVELATGGRQGGARPDPLAATAQQYPDDPEPAALERWTSRSTRHAMAAEVVVGTVDQALLAALAARHAHLRLAGVVRHLLVVDEVHAYDRYMTTALRTLITMHTAVGGTVLFMSATLASETRTRLGDDGFDAVTPAMDAAIARPYPSLSLRASEGTEWHETWLPANADRTRSVRWSLAAEADTLGAATRAADRGARVLVLRNTVRDARATLDTLINLGADALLWRPRRGLLPTAYHARYTTGDRAALDVAVLRDFGPGEGARGVVLVATQVAEQSLDLDFDLLVTDLCPVDVLLQRLGRVHRHLRPDRAGYDRPSALVIEPDTPLAQLVAARKRSTTHGHGTVYSDLGDLELTRRLVASRPDVTLPSACRALVEAVYHPEARRALGAESDGWSEHLKRQDGDAMGAETHAEVCTICFDRAYHDSANTSRFGTLDAGGGSVEARVRTRLGDDRVRLALPAAAPNCVASDSPCDTFVDLDTRTLLRAGIEPASFDRLTIDAWEEAAARLTFKVGRLQVMYDDRGWAWTTAS